MLADYVGRHTTRAPVFPQNEFAPYRTVWHCTPGSNREHVP